MTVNSKRKERIGIDLDSNEVEVKINGERTDVSMGDLVKVHDKYAILTGVSVERDVEPLYASGKMEPIGHEVKQESFLLEAEYINVNGTVEFLPHEIEELPELEKEVIKNEQRK